MMNRYLFSTLVVGVIAAVFFPSSVHGAEARIMGKADLKELGGSDFQGGSGDYLLANDKVWAVVLAIDTTKDFGIPLAALYHSSRGILIDAGTTGDRNDQLTAVGQFINFDLQYYIDYHRLVEMESEDDRAWIKLAGTIRRYWPGETITELVGLEVETTYSVTDGSSWIDIETQVINNSGVPAAVFHITDTELKFGRGNLPFQPFPHRGPKPPPLDFSDPWAAIGVFPFVASPGQLRPEDGPMTDDGRTVGEVCYTWVAAERGHLLFGLGEARMLMVGPAFDLDAVRRGEPPRIAPGEALQWKRRFIVTRGNTVASGVEVALPLLLPHQPYSERFTGRLIDATGQAVHGASVLVNNTQPGIDPAWLREIQADLGYRGIEGLITVLDEDQDRNLDGVSRARRGMSWPMIQTVTDENGEFSFLLPSLRPVRASVYRARIQAPHRPPIHFGPLTVEGTAGTHGETDLGVFHIAPTGFLDFSVTDARTGEGMPARLHFACADAHGRPYFGSQYLTPGNYSGLQERMECGGPGLTLSRAANLPGVFGGYPSYDVDATADGQGVVELAPGSYCVRATRGPEYTMDHACFTIEEGVTRHLELSLTHQVDTPGLVSLDAHIHAAHSFDSSIPYADRALSYLAGGVDVMVMTEHDHVADIRPAIRHIGAEGTLAAIVGTEMTPTLALPNEVSPQLPVYPGGVGHMNAWPVRPIPENRRNGMPQDEYVLPATAIDRLRGMSSLPDLGTTPDEATLEEWLRALHAGETGTPGRSLPARDEVVMLNHPRSGRAFQIMLGTFNGLANPSGQSWYGGYQADQTLDTFPNRILKLKSAYHKDRLAGEGAGKGDSHGHPHGTDTTGLSFDAVELMTGPSVRRYHKVRRDWFSLLDQGVRMTAVANSDSHTLTLATNIGFVRTYVMAENDQPGTIDENELARNVKAMKAFGSTGPVLHFTVDGDDGREYGMGETVSVLSDRISLHVQVEAVPWMPVEEVRFFVNGCRVRTLEVDAPEKVLGGDVLRFDRKIALDVMDDAYVTVEAGVCLKANGAWCHPELKSELPETVSNVVPIAFSNPIFIDRDGDGESRPPGLPSQREDPTCEGRDVKIVQSPPLRPEVCEAGSALDVVTLGSSEQEIVDAYGEGLSKNDIVPPRTEDDAMGPEPDRPIRLRPATLADRRQPPDPFDEPYRKQKRWYRPVDSEDPDVRYVEYETYDGEIYRIRWRLAPFYERPVMSRLSKERRIQDCQGSPIESQEVRAAPGQASLWRVSWMRGDVLLEVRQLDPLDGGPTYLSITDLAAVREMLGEEVLPAPQPALADPWWSNPQHPYSTLTDDESDAVVHALAALMGRTGFGN